jgi:hypothetical protein
MPCVRARDNKEGRLPCLLQGLVMTKGRLLPFRTLRSRYARNDKRESATPSARARDDKEGRLLPFRTLRSRFAVATLAMTKRGSVLGQETFAIRCKGEVVATPCARARDDKKGECARSGDLRDQV